MSKAPAFQFYTGDWRKDPAVQSLDYEHRGIWIELITIMWDTPERGRMVMPDGRAMPDASIARILGIPVADWKQKRSTLLAHGTASEDDARVFYCRRMVRSEKDRHQKAEAGRKGGLAKRKVSTPTSEPISETGVYRAEDEDEEVVVVEVVLDKTKDGNLVYERLGKVLAHTEAQATKGDHRSELARVVFTYWAARTGADPRRTKWDDRRRTRLTSRLKENDDDVAELLCVVDGALKDDFHRGNNDRNKPFLQIQTIFRDREMVEKLAKQSPHFGKPVHPFMAAP